MQDLKTTLSGAAGAVLALLAHFHIVVPPDLQMPIIALAVAMLGYFSKDRGKQDPPANPASPTLKTPLQPYTMALVLFSVLGVTLFMSGCGKFSVHKLAVGCDVAVKVATTAVDLESHFAQDGIIQPDVHTRVKPRFDDLKKAVTDIANDIDALDKSGQSLTAGKKQEVYTALQDAIEIARDLNRDEVLQIKNPEHRLILASALEAFSTGLDLVSAEF